MEDVVYFSRQEGKGDNSSKYVEKLWGKRCSSNSFHVLKVKENELFKEKKTVIKKRQKCLCVRKETSFLQESHYLTLTFFHCNSLQYLVIRIHKGSLQGSLY